MLRAALVVSALSLGLTAAPVARAESGPAPVVTHQQGASVQAVFDAIGAWDILAVMSAEGVAQAAELEDGLFPGQGGAAWAATVARIYEARALSAAFVAAFPGDTLSEADLAEMLGFFTSDLGQRIVAGEVAARQEISVEGIEELANQIYRERLAAGDPRLDLLQRFNDVNGLVELNVAGALNSNLAFFRGLADAGALERDMPEEMMLDEVWSQEPEIRAETVLWLYSYEIMAYDGLSDADLEAYIAFSVTPAGRAFNRALFQAFDVLFEDISYRLGQAAAVFIVGEET